MAEPRYVIAPQVDRELFELREKLKARVKLHLMTAKDASDWYWGQVRKIMGQIGAHQQVENTRNVAVRCSSCDRLEMIPGNIMTYTCACSPDVEQFTFRNRIILGGHHAGS